MVTLRRKPHFAMPPSGQISLGFEATLHAQGAYPGRECAITHLEIRLFCDHPRLYDDHCHLLPLRLGNRKDQSVEMSTPS
jgi:hypothetical protein